jgi:alpha-D-ribose 1-methylphosphonate 5-triphosphate diphosphatase
MSVETVLNNANLVLPDQVVTGSLVLRDGRIAEIQSGSAQAGLDLDGDYLLPGIIDVHTDNLERQVLPRSNARWPSRSALFAHDAQCAAAGVTTVLDALCLGHLGYELERIRTFQDGVADLDALVGTPLLKAEHFLHLRCEIPAADMLEHLEPMAGHPAVRMVSLMDHTPGFGQYADTDIYRRLRRKDGWPDDRIERSILELHERRAILRDPNRQRVLALMAGGDIALASHDDRTAEEIAENHADGIKISEFPVTMEAARAARAHGMQVIAGGPNIVRGGSHSGNVSVADLVRADVVDALASDYVPASLVEAAFLCVGEAGITLPQAIGLVTERPARMAGLPDRGAIAVGLRADLVRVRLHEGIAVVRAVWRGGERVA